MERMQAVVQFAGPFFFKRGIMDKIKVLMFSAVLFCGYGSLLASAPVDYQPRTSWIKQKTYYHYPYNYNYYYYDPHGNYYNNKYFIYYNPYNWWYNRGTSPKFRVH